MTQEHNYLPGNLVHARGREWVVQNESSSDWLRLRPLGGTDDDVIALIPEIGRLLSPTLMFIRMEK